MRSARQGRMLCGLSIFLALACPAWAQWDSGSDGSDLDYTAVSVEVDLGLAASLCDCDAGGVLNDPCRWDCPSPVAGQGVYDAERWVVVFKHTTIDIPVGVTVTFKNHPSGAPVVWLASGNVSISGTVDLNGKNGTTSGQIPSFAEGGPGGWAGGQRGYSGVASGISAGFGPGSSTLLAGCCTCQFAATPSAHRGVQPGGGASNGKIYDSGIPYFSPLHGGSGGTAIGNVSAGAGGGGGGAIFIACGSSLGTEVLTLGSGARIFTNGGNGTGTGSVSGAGGSGGIIRLRTPTLSVTSGAQLRATDGLTGNCFGTGFGSGSIRIEAGTVTLGLFPSSNPGNAHVMTASPLFPTDPPVVRIVSIDAETVTADPVMGILSTEVTINNSGSVIVDIEGEGFPGSPASVTVEVRVIPARGAVTTASATLTDPEPDGIYTGSASVTSFLSGRSEVQVRWPVPP